MPEYTDPYGLTMLGPGEHFSENSYKYTRADRALMARLLQLGAEAHRHTGGVVDLPMVDEGPLLTLNTNDGGMPAGVRFFYCYTVVDVNGFESSASPVVFADTPANVLAPAAPTAAIDTTGTLPPGNFYYVVSAYTQYDNLETVAGAAAYASVPYGSLSNSITLTLPVLPGGADGFNVYRRTPSGSAYYHIGTIDMSGATPPTSFVDDGTRAENCDRVAPEISTALARNSITVLLPASTVVPVGSAWRIYRSSRAGEFSNSLLTTITDGSVEYKDIGIGTQLGQPPTQGVAPGAPSQIMLTDGREVQGRLPLSQVSGFPHTETFSLVGQVEVMTGSTPWICAFPQADLREVHLSLGRDSVPNATDVILNINKYDAGAWVSVVGSTPPTIEVGDNVGAPVLLNVPLVRGDRLTIDVDQAGGGTNTDIDLVIVLYFVVYGYIGGTSYTWTALP